MNDKTESEQMIAALIDGELSAKQAAKARRSILADPALRKTYEEVLAAQDLFNESLHILSSDTFADSLANQIRTKTHNKTPNLNKMPKRKTAIAASLTIGVLVGLLGSQFGAQQTPLPQTTSSFLVDVDRSAVTQLMRPTSAKSLPSTAVYEKSSLLSSIASSELGKRFEKLQPENSETFRALVDALPDDAMTLTAQLRDLSAKGHLPSTIALAELQGTELAIEVYRELLWKAGD